MSKTAVDAGGRELVEHEARYAGRILEDVRFVLISVRDRTCLCRNQQRDQNSIGQPPRISEKLTHGSDYIPNTRDPKMSDPELALWLQHLIRQCGGRNGQIFLRIDARAGAHVGNRNPNRHTKRQCAQLLQLLAPLEP